MIVISPATPCCCPAGRTLAPTTGKAAGKRCTATTAWSSTTGCARCAATGRPGWKRPWPTPTARCCWWRTAWAASSPPGGRPTFAHAPPRCAAPCWWPRAMWSSLTGRTDPRLGPHCAPAALPSPPCWWAAAMTRIAAWSAPKPWPRPGAPALWITANVGASMRESGLGDWAEGHGWLQLAAF